LANSAEESDEHSADLDDLVVACYDVGFWEQVGVGGEVKMGFQLRSRRDGDLDKLREIAIGCPRTSLNRVARSLPVSDRRYGRASRLENDAWSVQESAVKALRHLP
jgi:hypothetical protein